MLSLFFTALGRQELRYVTIKTYLAAVRNAQILAGGGDPLAAYQLMLDHVLSGIKREQGQPAADPRLPITSGILRQLRAVWGETAYRWDSVMLWTACTVAFFGFLRADEFTVDLAAAFDPERHLAERRVDGLAREPVICEATHQAI